MMQDNITLEKAEEIEGTMKVQEPTQPDQKQNKAHFSKLGSMMFCGTLIIVFVQAMAMGIASVVNPDITEHYNALLAVQMLPMYIIGYPLMFLLVKQVRPVNVAVHEMTGKQIFAAFTMVYVLMIFGNLLGLGVTNVISLLKGGEVVNPLLNIVSTGNIWLTAIYTVLLAPVFEEILFRKMIVDRTIRYGEGTAIVVSGVMFGLFHGNLNQFVYALPMGLFCAFIYAKTGKIKYTIMMHMAANFMGSFLGPFCTTVLEAGSTAQMAASAVFSILVFAFLASGVVFFIISRKKFRLNAGEVTLEKGSRFRTVFLNLGMILYCGFWLINIILMLFM